jgi:hypothetical protein
MYQVLSLTKDQIIMAINEHHPRKLSITEDLLTDEFCEQFAHKIGECILDCLNTNNKNFITTIEWAREELSK